MGWFVFIILMALLFIGARAISRMARREQNKLDAAGIRSRSDFPPALAARVFGVASYVVVGVALLVTISSMAHTVENGHVALVYQFGQIKGQRGTGEGGYVFTAPWESIKQVNVQVQKIVPQVGCSDGTKNCLDAASNESQDVFITPSININVDYSKVQSLYQRIGPDWINILVEPRIAQVTKEETAKYKATEIIPNREVLRATITKRLKEELAPDSITVDDFLITDVHFSKAFNDGIEAKVIAETNAQAEQNKVAISKAQADQAVAVAKGQADAQVTLAKGQADSNALINASLTPGLIQWQTINKLAPDVKVIMLPSNQGIILNAGDLTGSVTPTK